MKNILGQRGEALFYILITKFYGRRKPIFRPQFLGDKWPTVDFVVELVDYTGNIAPYFFVQVKTTRQGYTKQKKRLKVQVPAREMQRLASLPAPTYVVGIDEINENGYIVSANGEYSEHLTSIHTQFSLNEETQNILWEEVKGFWETVAPFRITSKFVDPNWR